MARSLNKATIIGNVGSDPEVRSTGNGQKVATFSVATSQSWTDQSGNKKEKTQWHRIVLWRGLAEVAEKYVKKGDRIYLEGEIEYRSYENKDGQTVYTTEIVGREMIMLGGKGERGENGGGAQRSSQQSSKPAQSAPAGGDFPEDDDLPF